MGGIESEIVKKIELGNSFEDKGDFNKALEVYFSALTDIEDAIVDKYKSEEARWLISCICGVCSGQVKLATILESFQYKRSDSFGVNPPLY